jgi:hypothetical protein
MKLFAFGLAFVSLTGCVTATRGMHQSFEVVTVPPGAAIRTSNGLSCAASPCTFERVSREAEFTVTATLAGYREQTVEVKHELAPEAAAALAAEFAIPFGSVPALIDANFGATQNLTPNPLTITLERAP